jgi:hypothetical protein
MKLAEMREITLTGSGRIRRLLLRQLMDSGSWTAASRGRVQLVKQGRHHGGGDADHFGISTVSITWIVPLVAAMSALTTTAPLINTLPATVLIVTD